MTLLLDPIYVAHAASVLAAAVLTALWEGGLLVAMTMACLKLLPNITATVRALVWMAVFAVAALLPFLSIGDRQSADAGGFPPNVQIPEAWAVLIFAAWAAASIYRLVRLAHSAWRLHKLASSACVLQPGAEIAGLLQTQGRRWTRRRVELCSSDEVDVPSVVGFLRPRILLPSALSQEMAASDVQQVVLHELEHLRRLDDWTNLLQKLVLAVFPLNITLLWLERRLCAERELACDDGVLRVTGSRKAYAACLANLAERSLLRRSMLLALGAGQRRSELERRVYRILNTSQCHAGSWWNAASAVLILVAVAGLSTFCTRVPALITFGPGEAKAAVPARAEAIAQTKVAQSFSAMSARPTLVKAVMPDWNRGIPGPQQQTDMRHRVRRAPAQTPLYRLTLVRETTVARPHLVWTVADDSYYTYAALPLRGGWLIVQL